MVKYILNRPDVIIKGYGGSKNATNSMCIAYNLKRPVKMQMAILLAVVKLG